MNCLASRLALMATLASTMAAPKPPRCQWLAFKMDGCVPCQAAANDYRPQLERAGWMVSPVPMAHVRLIDSELNADLFAKHDVTTVPQFLLIVDGVVVERHYRYPGVMRLATAYNAEMKDLK